jgi:DsbC/DsbD-like thiol-disulfide interchange protein
MKHDYLAFMMALLLPAPLLAQDHGLISARLIHGGAGAQNMAALVVDLAPGWKTYWRSPGDSGIAAEFDWAGSQNLRQVSYFWPIPQVFDQAGEVTIGYTDQWVLPMAVAPMDAGLPVVLNGTITFGLCKDICLPMQIALSTTLPVDPPPNPVIDAAMAKLPMTAQAAGARDWSCSSQPIKDGVQMQLSLDMPKWAGAGPETVVVDHIDRKIWASRPQVQRQAGQLMAVFDLVPPQAAPFAVQGDDLRITILAGGQAAELQGCPVVQNR